MHSVAGEQVFDESLYLGTSAMVIIDKQLEGNLTTEFRDEESTLRVSLLNPQAKPLQGLLTLERVNSGL